MLLCTWSMLFVGFDFLTCLLNCMVTYFLHCLASLEYLCDKASSFSYFTYLPWPLPAMLAQWTLHGTLLTLLLVSNNSKDWWDMASVLVMTAQEIYKPSCNRLLVVSGKKWINIWISLKLSLLNKRLTVNTNEKWYVFKSARQSPFTHQRPILLTRSKTLTRPITNGPECKISQDGG